MAKPGFSPVLLLGLGGAGHSVVEQTRKHLQTLPPPLQELVEVLALDGSGVWTENLQAAVNRLKSGRLLQRAEEECQVNIRRSYGPLEINVFLTGRLGSAPGGLCLDAVLSELVRTGYAWSPELGFTGASVTVLALKGGKDAGARLVLNRMLETYRSDEFLDSYRGRIFLMDNSLKDGSKIEQPELVRLLARLLWLSIVPGDEPLLPGELGLIRMYEKEAKLATVGMDCYYPSWQESFYSQAAQLLKQQTDRLIKPGTPGKSADKAELILENATEKDILEVSTRLVRELDGENTAEAWDALISLENYLGSQKNSLAEHALGQRETGPGNLSLLPARIEVEAQMLEPAGLNKERTRISRAAMLGTALLAAAALYRLTADQLVPRWLSWLLGLLILSILLGFAFGGKGFGSRRTGLRGPTALPAAQLPRETSPASLTPSQPFLEELRRECLSARQDLDRLAGVLKETARELQTGRQPPFARPLKLKDASPPLPENLIPSGWRGLREEECRQAILAIVKGIAETQFESLQTVGLSDMPEAANPIPLLIYREGARPVRQAKTVKTIAGSENLVCVIGMYYGLEPNNISLR